MRGQPEAAVLGVAEPGTGQGFLSRGPSCDQGKSLESGRMGFTSFQSLSNEDKSATVYLPFLAGSKKKVSSPKTGREGARQGRVYMHRRVAGCEWKAHALQHSRISLAYACKPVCEKR